MKTMADVKWIKITTDIFDDEKILMIESMPSADSIIVIWFKLLTFAGKQNNNGVFLMSNRIAYTDEMLASIFRRDVNTVRLALKAFEQFGMIEIIDNVICIPNWSKHQSLDAYEKKKQRDRERIARKRAEQKLLIGKSPDVSPDMSPDSSPDASPDVASLEGDKEEERDKEEDIDNISPSKAVSQIVSFLNEKAGTKYKPTTAKTISLIRARLKDGFTIDDFRYVIGNKCAEWLNDPKMQRYLRPETLFGTKFEAYLNEKPVKARTKPDDRFYEYDPDEKPGATFNFDFEE